MPYFFSNKCFRHLRGADLEEVSLALQRVLAGRERAKKARLRGARRIEIFPKEAAITSACRPMAGMPRTHRRHARPTRSNTEPTGRVFL